MGKTSNRDTDPDGFSETDTEVEVIGAPQDSRVCARADLDTATDEHDIVPIHDRVPADTDRMAADNDQVAADTDRVVAETDRVAADTRRVGVPAWLASATLPFLRGANRLSGFVSPVRLDTGPPVVEGRLPSVGQRYLNYHIRRRLPRGSMGIVYEAAHLHLDRRVAIKFLSPNLLGNENMVYRFLGEAKALARLEHPGIPTVFDFGQDSAGNAYLVMHYFDGESLAAKLEHAPIALDRSLEVGAQVAEILAVAHAENIIHRDLKPENILLGDHDKESPRGPQPVVRLIDFGICKTRSTDQRASTAAGNLIGTPRYMAPEQTYSREVTCKTDVYALGCVIFELVCGRPPFEGKLAELVDAHRHRPAPDIRDHRPAVPALLAKVVALMLAKDSSARPSSGRDLASALRECKRPLETDIRRSRARRAALPTPRASTARSDVEAGVLTAEQTPIPFHLAGPALGRPIIGRERSAPLRRGQLGGTGTTEIAVGPNRLTWLLVAALVCLATLALSVISATL